jgi:predicted TPR repeat methyltransferase
MLANSVVDHAAAEQHLRAAFAQKPDIVGIKRLIGNALRYQSKFDEAEVWLQEAVGQNPADGQAHYSLGMIAYERGHMDAARTHLADAIRLNPNDEIFLYTHAVVNGSTPARQPEALVRNVFDGYASQIDRHMPAILKDHLPQLIADKIVAQFPSRNINVLDLGCGTGLLGVALGKVDGHFAGVDLSLGMLKEAEKKNVYSRLHNVNLLDALAATAANDYDVVVAADVFSYVGDLDAVLGDAFTVLKPGGWLFFSCESAAEDGPDFVLSKNMRYTHPTHYVKRLLAAAGFATTTIDTIDLRSGHDVPLPGYIVSAQKPN